jgi:hypothetical protein
MNLVLGFKFQYVGKLVILGLELEGERQKLPLAALGHAEYAL